MGWTGWIVGGVVFTVGCKDSGGETSESFGLATMTDPSGTATQATTSGTTESSATDPGTDSSTAEAMTSEDTTAGGSTSSETGTTDASTGGPFCGDGNVDDGEARDDGNDDDSDACPSTCEEAICGDGFVYEGVELCDDGNLDNSDACLATCEPATCGDGFVYEGLETCDDGNDDDSDGCPSTCENATCGDGFIQAGIEACDDGNEMSDDGCTPDCEIATSCKQILATDPDASDGLYLVDFDADGPLLAEQHPTASVRRHVAIDLAHLDVVPPLVRVSALPSGCVVEPTPSSAAAERRDPRSSRRLPWSWAFAGPCALFAAFRPYAEEATRADLLGEPGLW